MIPSPLTPPSYRLTSGSHQGSGIGRLIRRQTRSPYSHVSLATDDGVSLETRESRGVALVPHGSAVELETTASVRRRGRGFRRIHPTG